MNENDEHVEKVNQKLDAPFELTRDGEVLGEFEITEVVYRDN